MKPEEPRIQMYFHCKTCIERNDEQYLAAGWTPEGIQIVCESCGNTIIDLDFMGQKVTYYEKKVGAQRAGRSKNTRIN